MAEKTLYYKHDGEWEKLNKSPNIEIGTVEHLNSDSSPYVHNVGDDQNIVLNFGIPKGEDGEDAVTAINPRGDYDDEAVYERNDYVTGPDGNSYVWKVEESGSGHPPTTGHKDDPYWQLFVIRGNTGDKGATFIPELSEDGTLSWTNTGDFDNPAPKKITASIQIGEVEAVDFDTSATVTNSGTEHNAILDFQVPRGEAATVEIGTVLSIEPSETATIVNSGTSSNAILDFSLPRGEKGHSATIQIGDVHGVSSDEMPKVVNKGTSEAAILEFSIPQGLPGKSTSIELGNISTLTAGSDATITNTGTEDEMVLNFGIPKGEDGISPTIRVNNVTQVSSSTPPSVTNVGNETNIILDFQIPKGEKGEKGENGRDAVAAINPRGIYDVAETYHRNDYITGLDGNSYVCSVEEMTGIAPPHENWQLLALKGADGKSFTWEDLTDEQKEALRGEKGQSGEMVLAYGAYDYENVIVENITSFAESSYKCREAVASNSGLAVIRITQAAGSSDYIYLFVNNNRVMLVPVRSGSVSTDICVPVAKGDRITAKTRIEPTGASIIVYPYKIDHIFTDKISSLSVAVGDHGPDVVPTVINKGTPTNPELEFNLKDGEVYVTEGDYDYENMIDVTSLIKAGTTTSGSTTIYTRTITVPENGLLMTGISVGSAGYWYVNVNDRRIGLWYSRSGGNQTSFRVSKGDVVQVLSNVSITAQYGNLYPFKKSETFTQKISSFQVKLAEHSESTEPGVVNTGTTTDPVLEFYVRDGEKGDTGDTGKSAYEVAVANGFKGTEEEWLYSLRVNEGMSEVDLSQFLLRDEALDYKNLLSNQLTEVDLIEYSKNFLQKGEIADYKEALLVNLTEVDLIEFSKNFMQKGEIQDYRDDITSNLVEIDLTEFSQNFMTKGEIEDYKEYLTANLTEIDTTMFILREVHDAQLAQMNEKIAKLEERIATLEGVISG